MQNLPAAEIYQREADYMPWGVLLEEILDYVNKNVPKNGRVVDILCGTGYLLGKLYELRPDLNLTGVDLEHEYIGYANKQYSSVNFEVADVLEWNTDDEFDAVLCTGGLHHLPYEKQENLIEKIGYLLDDKGFAIVADPYIDSYSNETERKVAAAKLGYEYLVATIKNGASEDVIKATASLINNDISLVEFKNSVENIEPYFKKKFSFVEKHKTWPNKGTEYGDYYFILKK